MKKLKWHTEQRIINDLIPYKENPRTMTEKQKNDLEESLKRFNLMSIPVINTDIDLVSRDIRESINSINKDQIKECLKEFFWKKEFVCPDLPK